jgi:pilus assembly protein Flp/PilA
MVRMFRDLILASRRLADRPTGRVICEREEGQTFVEYALLIAFIAIVALVAVQLLGTNVSSLFNSVAGSI